MEKLFDLIVSEAGVVYPRPNPSGKWTLDEIHDWVYRHGARLADAQETGALLGIPQEGLRS